MGTLHPCLLRRSSKRFTLYGMSPRPRGTTRPVQVRLEQTLHDELAAIGPTVSAAIRRLLTQALKACNGETAGQDHSQCIQVSPDGLSWIDTQAAQAGVTRDDMVKTLLREASTARTRNRKA